MESWLESTTPWLNWSGTIGLAFFVWLLCAVGWATNAFGLPGNWFAVAVAGLYAWLGPSTGGASVGVGTVVAMAVVAGIGEAIEFAAGAVGAQRAGASRRSIIYSMVGSMLGAIIGAGLGVPIPVIGSLVAAVFFGGLGAAAGAMFGEWNEGRDWQENLAIGNATFWGRTIGTLGKILAGLVSLIIVTAGLIL